MGTKVLNASSYVAAKRGVALFLVCLELSAWVPWLSCPLVATDAAITPEQEKAFRRVTTDSETPNSVWRAVAGRHKDTSTSFNGEGSTIEAVAVGSKDGDWAIVGLGPRGMEATTLNFQFGTPEHEEATAVSIPDPRSSWKQSWPNNFVVVGTSRGSLFLDKGVGPNQGLRDIYIAAFTSGSNTDARSGGHHGGPAKVIRVGSGGDDVATGVAHVYLNSQQYVVVVGHTNGHLSTRGDNNRGGYDAFYGLYYLYGTTGRQVCARTIGTNHDEYIYGVAPSYYLRGLMVGTTRGRLHDYIPGYVNHSPHPGHTSNPNGDFLACYLGPAQETSSSYCLHQCHQFDANGGEDTLTDVVYSRADSDSSNSGFFVAVGSTTGSLGSPNKGLEDIVMVQFNTISSYSNCGSQSYRWNSGNTECRPQVIAQYQTGSSGSDKAEAVTRRQGSQDNYFYIAGHTTGTIGTSSSGTGQRDAFLLIVQWAQGSYTPNIYSALQIPERHSYGVYGVHQSHVVNGVGTEYFYSAVSVGMNAQNRRMVSVASEQCAGQKLTDYTCTQYGAAQPVVKDNHPVCQLCPLSHYALYETYTWQPQTGLGTFNRDFTCMDLQDCIMGRYHNDRGKCQSSPNYSYTCHECPTGTFNNRLGSNVCTSCRPGSYQDLTGQTTCKACGVGKYNPNSGSVSSSACIDCFAGSFADKIGTDNCKACERGYYQDNTGATECKRCPYDATSLPAAYSSAQCVCGAGSYGDPQRQPPETCLPCPKGTKCSEDQRFPLAEEGFWFSIDESSGARISSVLECYPKRACSSVVTADGSSVAECSEGYAGRGCSECADGFYRESHECVECTVEEMHWGFTFAAAAAIIVMLPVTMLCFLTGFGADPPWFGRYADYLEIIEEHADADEEFNGAEANLYTGCKSCCSSPGKIAKLPVFALPRLMRLFKFGQIVGIAAAVQVDWPNVPLFSSFIRTISSITLLSFSAVAQPECRMGSSFPSEAFFHAAKLLAPFVIVIFGFLPVLYTIRMCKIYVQKNSRAKTSEVAKNSHRVKLRQFLIWFVRNTLICSLCCNSQLRRNLRSFVANYICCRRFSKADSGECQSKPGKLSFRSPNDPPAREDIPEIPTVLEIERLENEVNSTTSGDIEVISEKAGSVMNEIIPPQPSSLHEPKDNPGQPVEGTASDFELVLYVGCKCAKWVIPGDNDGLVMKFIPTQLLMLFWCAGKPHLEYDKQVYKKHMIVMRVTEASLDAYESRLTRVLLLFLNMCYVFLHIAVLTPFACHHQGDGVYLLTSSPSIQCYSSDASWISMVVFSCIFLIVYSIGYPVVNVLMILKGYPRYARAINALQDEGASQTDIMAEEMNPLHAPYKWMWDDYRPEYYYWDMIILLEKFTIPLSMLFVVLGSQNEANAMLCLLFMFLLAQLFSMPFKKKVENFVESNCMLSVCLFILVGLMSNTSDGQPLAATIMAYVCAGYFYFVFGFTVSVTLYEFVVGDVERDADRFMDEFWGRGASVMHTRRKLLLYVLKKIEVLLRKRLLTLCKPGTKNDHADSEYGYEVWLLKCAEKIQDSLQVGLKQAFENGIPDKWWNEAVEKKPNLSTSTKKKNVSSMSFYKRTKRREREEMEKSPAFFRQYATIEDCVNKLSSEEAVRDLIGLVCDLKNDNTNRELTWSEEAIPVFCAQWHDHGFEKPDWERTCAMQIVGEFKGDKGKPASGKRPRRIAKLTHCIGLGTKDEVTVKHLFQRLQFILCCIMRQHDHYLLKMSDPRKMEKVYPPFPNIRKDSTLDLMGVGDVNSVENEGSHSETEELDVSIDCTELDKRMSLFYAKTSRRLNWQMYSLSVTQSCHIRLGQAFAKAEAASKEREHQAVKSNKSVKSVCSSLCRIKQPCLAFTYLVWYEVYFSFLHNEFGRSLLKQGQRFIRLICMCRRNSRKNPSSEAIRLAKLDGESAPGSDKLRRKRSVEDLNVTKVIHIETSPRDSFDLTSKPKDGLLTYEYALLLMMSPFGFQGRSVLSGQRTNLVLVWWDMLLTPWPFVIDNLAVMTEDEAAIHYKGHLRRRSLLDVSRMPQTLDDMYPSSLIQLVDGINKRCYQYYLALQSGDKKSLQRLKKIAAEEKVDPSLENDHNDNNPNADRSTKLVSVCPIDGPAGVNEIKNSTENLMKLVEEWDEDMPLQWIDSLLPMTSVMSKSFTSVRSTSAHEGSLTRRLKM